MIVYMCMLRRYLPVSNAIASLHLLVRVAIQCLKLCFISQHSLYLIKVLNTQKVSVTKIVDFTSFQCAGSKYGLRIKFLVLVVMI